MVWSGVTKDASQSVVLSTALGFLLVFRLNRVAVRWWECRGTWGMIVAYARMLTSAICEHLAHSPTQRDLAVAWIAAFCVACKQFIRGEGHNISPAELAGVLAPRELDRLRQAPHPPLYCCGEIRHAIQKGLRIHHDDAVNSNNIAASVAWSSISRHLETSIDALIVNVGGLERVRASPLPMVYVSHLRTVLLLYLLCLPYIIGPAWGYFTIPTIFLTSFSLLGIDGAAAECEAPFRKNRMNHLDMEVSSYKLCAKCRVLACFVTSMITSLTFLLNIYDITLYVSFIRKKAYCQMAFKNMLQIMIDAADRERRERAKDD